MKFIVNVQVEIEGREDWNFRVNDALRNIGHEIYMHPQYVGQKGDGSGYTFEYTVKGEE